MPKYALLIASLLTGVSACDRQPVAPADLDPPAYNWMNNPFLGAVWVAIGVPGFAGAASYCFICRFVLAMAPYGCLCEQNAENWEHLTLVINGDT